MVTVQTVCRVVRNIKDGNNIDLMDTEINRISRGFGDYERFERC